jgi:uncharacterized protein with GYD domain
MAKYMLEATYTLDGIKGIAGKGGTARKAAVQAATKSVGGKLDAFFFAFGGTDAYVIVDLPDNTAAAALALAVAASGAVNLKTVVLLTPDEIDAATSYEVKYRAPGT